jgi:heptosyltransferase-1
MKICIVKLSALGDIIHTMVVLQFIKEKYPNSRIDWVAENGFKDILTNNPNIDNILPINLKSLKTNKLNIFSQVKLIRKYKNNNYDFVIDAQGLLKSAIVSKLISNNKNIIGFSKDSIREGLASMFYNKTISIGYDKNVIDRNVKLVNEALDINIGKKEIINKKPFLFSKVYNIKNIDILFVLGASKENKIYPKEKFAQLADSLKEYSIEAIWANKYEKEAAEYISKKCNNVKVCSKMSLDELKEKIKKTSLVIGGDTGPTHMAWGLNIPSLTIFGNTPEYRNTYITDINKVVKSDSTVDALKLDKSDFSIRNIDVNSILILAKELLEND